MSEVSLDNFVQVALNAIKRSGFTPGDVTYVCPIHLKRSMHTAVLTALGLDGAQAVYLDDTGHLSGADNLLGLDRLARAGRLHDGDVILLLAAGIGYTWAATVLQWGRGAS
ncbi:MAG: 3-oxoacyl-[acyl-carrier-protein] synthase III C-terminal domain-containing protein [Streptosporangiaceae bacterium]